MNKTRILVIDDQEDILKSLQKFLAGKGHEVLVAKDSSSGYLMAQEAVPHLILLDSQLPGMDGHKLCRVLKKDPRTAGIPVILMSGVWITDKDQVSGLEGGADDYLPKPFSMAILQARISAVLRRSRGGQADSHPLLSSGPVALDRGARTASVAGRPVKLTAKEFDLLAAMLSRPGRVLTATQLLQEVWGYDPAVYNDPHTVEVHVSSLRKKLGAKAAGRLINVIGHGYRWES